MRGHVIAVEFHRASTKPERFKGLMDPSRMSRKLVVPKQLRLITEGCLITSGSDLGAVADEV